jgi:hypothetical protein
MGRLRRLQHGESATLVDHLEELRWRVFVMLCALAVTSTVAHTFHGHILDWLNHPLPADRRRVVTLGVAEPFTVSLTVSVYAKIPARAARDPVAALVVPRARVRPLDRVSFRARRGFRSPFFVGGPGDPTPPCWA